MHPKSRRIYHFHVRKTAGSSLNAAFWALGGPAVQSVERAGGETATGNGLTFTEDRDRIEAGDFFFANSHRPAQRLTLPPDTFTVTILRDPISRVISYYRYAIWARSDPDADSQEPFAPRVREGSWFLDGGLDYLRTQLKPERVRVDGGIRTLGFRQFAARLGRLRRTGTIADLIARMPPRRLCDQLYMFSQELDPKAAAERALACDAVLFTESFGDDLRRLGSELGLELGEQSRKRFGEEVEISDEQRQILGRRLSREYEMIERVRDGLQAG